MESLRYRICLFLSEALLEMDADDLLAELLSNTLDDIQLQLTDEEQERLETALEKTLKSVQDNQL